MAKKSKWKGAALSLLGSIPFVGKVKKGIKAAKKAAKTLQKKAQTTKKKFKAVLKKGKNKVKKKKKKKKKGKVFTKARKLMNNLKKKDLVKKLKKGMKKTVLAAKKIQKKAVKYVKVNAKEIASFAVDMVPYVGTVKGFQQAAVGVDLITGQRLSTGDRVAEGVGVLTSLIPIPGAKQVGKYGTKGIMEAGEFIADTAINAVNKLKDGGSSKAPKPNKPPKETKQAEKFTKEELATKPKNSPDPEKWQKKGGKITTDDSGTWTYHDWEGNSVTYPGGYPDFNGAGMVKQEVDIGEFESYPKDFAKADEMAPNGPKSDKSTWHHHQDGKTMQEVDKELHDRYRHRGGMSLSRKKKK